MFRTNDVTFSPEYLPPSLCFAEGDPPADAAAGGGAPDAAANAGDTKEAATKEEGKPADENASKEAKNEPEKPNWSEKRIRELVIEKNTERQRAEKFETEAALLRSQLEAMQRSGERPSDPGDPVSAPKDAGRKPLTEAEIERMVEERVKILTLNEAANRTGEAGLKAFEDFADTRQALLGAYGDVIQRRPDFIEAITEIPNGHEVFYRLGKDLDLAGQVLNLSPARMAVRLAQLANEAKSDTKPKAPALSKAPPPIRTVDGAAKANEPTVYDAGTNKVDMATWMRLRDKEERDAKIAKYGKAS